MDYSNCSKEQLIQIIEELQMLNRHLLMEKEQELGLDFAWTGNLGHWYWNIKTNTVTFNSLKVTNLGYSQEEIPEKVTFQFFTDKLHPEDYPNTMEAMRKHLHGEVHVYEVEYRIRTKEGSYRWYYDRGKITQYGPDGKPVFLAGIVFDITEKKVMQQELEMKNQTLMEQSSTDGLTGVKNRRALIEYLQAELNNTSQSKQPLAITLFDIDHFKTVNDTKGHLYGDKVLKYVAQILQKNIRDTDVVGRYGGEEFMIILKETSEGDARAISERIRRSIEQHCFDENVRITISGGVYEYHAGDSLIDLIDKSDQNLYQAKKQGRNQIV